MSGYGRLRRGPMGADILGEQFSQTYNGVWRDTRITPKAMGVFGNLSTHRDGYGLSAKAISKQMKAGVSMIKAALVELEEVGYLYRLQLRNGDGTVGDTMYFITDIPDHVDIAEHARQSYAQSGATKTAMVITKQSRRSAPVIENPPADKPLADNHPPKKTNYKNTSTTEDSKEGEEGAHAREIDPPPPPATPPTTTTTAATSGASPPPSAPPPIRGPCWLRPSSPRSLRRPAWVWSRGSTSAWSWSTCPPHWPQ